MRVGGQHHAPAAFTHGERPGTHCTGWASEPLWIGAENLAHTGIRPPDLPARSESLYRLRYPSSLEQEYNDKFQHLGFFYVTINFTDLCKTGLRYDTRSQIVLGLNILLLLALEAMHV